VLVRSLVEALEECRRMQGSVMKKWFYGKYLRLAINHPVGHQIPVVHRYFDIGPVPASGGSTSVKQTTPRLGPSERFDADLNDWDNSLLNLPIGESAHVLSKHYRDEWDAYYNGTSYPMSFDHVEVKSTQRFELRIGREDNVAHDPKTILVDRHRFVDSIQMKHLGFRPLHRLRFHGIRLGHLPIDRDVMLHARRIDVHLGLQLDIEHEPNMLSCGDALGIRRDRNLKLLALLDYRGGRDCERNKKAKQFHKDVSTMRSTNWIQADLS
jgi:hypothetical protein